MRMHVMFLAWCGLALSVSTLPAAVILFQEESLPNSGYSATALDIRSSTSNASNAVAIPTYQVNRGFAAPTNVNPSTTTAVGSVLIGRIGTSGGNDDRSRGLFSFDLSAIPAGATINSVSLTLFSAGPDANSLNQNFTVNLHQLNGSIVESGDTFNTAGPSWIDRDVNGSVAWTTPGGDFFPEILSSFTANPTTIALDTAVVFGSSASFVAAAQSALEGAGTLHMLALSLNAEAETSRSLFQFRSDDALITVPRPVTLNPLLIVDYTPVPEPASMAIIAIAVTMLLPRMRRSKV